MLPFLVPGLVNSLSISTLVLITITWEPPLMPHNAIIAYEVSYQGEDGGQEVRNVTSTSVELTGLRTEYTYTISVRAYTSAGPGMERILTVPATIFASTCELALKSAVSSSTSTFVMPVICYQQVHCQ